MDIENLLKELKRAERYCLNDYSRMAGQAATALSTLQAENEKLRAYLEYEREHADAYYQECRQWEAENEKLRAELEQVKRERDAAIKDIWVPKWISCKNGENCSYVSAITGMPDCAGCDNWEWRGMKED